MTDDSSANDEQQDPHVVLSQKAELLRLCDEVELFHTSDGDAYATLENSDHRENWAVQSSQFKMWLVRGFYQRAGTAADRASVQSVLGVLEGRAKFDGSEINVHTRLAGYEGRLYLDLANDSWECVEIRPDGWKVISDPPVRFRRPAGLLPLPAPAPAPGGELSELRGLLNVTNDNDFELIVGWLINALREMGPYFILALYGEHGCAKSFTCRLLRSIVDPCRPDLAAIPRSTHDLMICAQNRRIIALDNISYISATNSDALCRISTGGGHQTRKLYTDSDEALLDVQRPILLNGIGDIITRGDLQDRAICIYLPRIPEVERRRESDLWTQFRVRHPSLLGALLTAVACSLKNEETTNLDSLPRMADAATWITAAEPALGWSGRTFINSYRMNQATSNETILEASPIAESVRSLLQEGDAWTGTAAALLRELTNHISQEISRTRAWPKQPHLLSRALRRLAPNLRAAGIGVDFEQTPGSNSRKLITLFTVISDASDASDAERVAGVAGVAECGDFVETEAVDL
jgi:hypothetical protein